MLNGLKNISAKCYKNPSGMLITTGAVSWGLGTASQVAGIKCNKKLTDKEKKFLIPQEIYDGITNIGLFLTFSLGCEKLTKKLVNKNFINLKNEKYLSPLLTVTSLVAGAIASNIITPIVRNSLGAIAQKKAVKNVNDLKTEQNV